MRKVLSGRAGVVAVLLAMLSGGVGAQVSRGVSSDGLAYEVTGSGEPVVLVHAFSVDRGMWQAQVAALADRFRVVTYDLRGHGDSIAPGEPYRGYDDLRSLLDELRIDAAALVGLSAGAELAINFAIAYPERVTRLVVASPGLGGFELPPLTWTQPVFAAAARGDPEGAATLWAETPIMRIHGNPAGREIVRALVMRNSQLWTYQRSELPLSPPAVGRLAEIRCPTLVIVGVADLPHIHDIAGVLERGIPGAKVTRIPGAGHIVNIDAPAAFDAALAEFITP